MQPRLSNPRISLLNLLKNPVPVVFISHEWIDNRHVVTVIEACFVSFNFALIVKQSVFRAVGLVNLDDYDLSIIRFGN